MEAAGQPSAEDPGAAQRAGFGERLGRADPSSDAEALIGALACLGDAALPSFAFGPAAPLPGKLGRVLADSTRARRALAEAEARGWVRREPDGWLLRTAGRQRWGRRPDAAAAEAASRWLEAVLPRDPEVPEDAGPTPGGEAFNALLPHVLPAVRAAAASRAPLDAAVLAAARAAAHLALRGDPEAAAGLLEATLEASGAAELADPFLRAVLTDQWASSLQDLGREADAREAAARAEVIVGCVCRPGEPRRVALLVNVGTIYKRQGDFLTAEVYFARALAELDAAGPEGAPLRVPVCLNLSDALRAQGKAREALAPADRAAREAEEMLGPLHPGTADALESLALAREAAGEAEAARPVWRRVAALYARQLGPTHPLAEAAARRVKVRPGA